MFEKFRPLADRVLIKRLDSEEKTASGIIIPDAAKEKAQTGKIVATGPGKRVDNAIVPLTVAIGDTVYFSKYAGTDAGDDHLILKEEDILGIVEK